MNINLNNYEPFFLLYADGELTAVEKLAVEAFVKLHPQLGEELELMKSLVLPAEDIAITDKTNLYRSAGLEHNMEEAMLLQLDDALPAAAAAHLQQSIAANESLQQHWDLLQKTKLPQEQVVFADKKSLYKPEPAKLVSLRVVRWAVAAALLAAGLFTAITLMRQQEKVAPGFATINLQGDEQDNKVPLAEDSFATRQKLQEGYSSGNEQLARQQQDVSDAPGAQDMIVPAKYAPAGKQQSLAQTNAPDKRDLLNTASQQDEQLPVLAAGSRTQKMPTPPHEITMPNALAVTEPRPEIIDRDIAPKTEQHVSYSSLQSEDEEELSGDRILGMDAQTVSRTKAGIFLKKLKRTVTRTVNIPTGNSLKIAGFEFAVK